tara:strand:- start:388 stop:1686 length:1299 start_codon:yes stop_codon:yes gene_type:complete
MTRKGVWDLQGVRDKYLQDQWINKIGLFGWGNNGSVELALGGPTGSPSTYADKSSPTQIGGWLDPATGWQMPGASNADRVGPIGGENALAIKTDGTLWGWGNDTYGVLGRNISGPALLPSPVQVGTNTTWKNICSKSLSAISVKTDGTMWSWGYNSAGNSGCLGLNEVGTDISSPTQVGTDTDWSSAVGGFTGANGSFAVKTNGTMWVWGSNREGQLGLNTYTNAPWQPGTYPGTKRSSPTQLGTDTTWTDKYTQENMAAYAIKSNGTLWSWGYNIQGQLGHNDRNQRSSPTQVGTDTDWTLVSQNGSTANRMLAVKTNGTLWVWGWNDRGQLGLNDIANRSSPTQLGTATNWHTSVRPATGDYYRSAALKTDGTLWVWGDNEEGSFGLNLGSGELSSPTQLPGGSRSWTGLANVGAKSFFGSQDYLISSQL